MLKFRLRRRRNAPPTLSSDHPDLRIRDLRDDPRLRRAMGLDESEPTALHPRHHRPVRRTDRRRPVDRAAA